MILHSMICSVLVYAAQAVGAAIDAAETEKAAAPTLQDDFSRIMIEIREKSPVLYRQMQSMRRAEALRLMFRALNSGVLSEKEYRAVQAKHKKIKREFFYGSLPDKRLFYLRTDRLDYAGIRSVLQRHATYSALILDLRTASGDDYDSVLPLLHFMKSVKRPTAILMGPLTSGASELFCAMAGKDSLFVTMGQPGAGQKFPMVKASPHFKGLYIPVIRDEFATVTPGDWKPEMRFPWRARITRAGLKNPGALMRDGLLTFAGDFLIGHLVLFTKK